MGAVMPSGRLLARTMAQYVDPNAEGPVIPGAPFSNHGELTRSLWPRDRDCAVVRLAERDSEVQDRVKDRLRRPRSGGADAPSLTRP